MVERLRELARLLAQRNAIDKQIANLIGRPAQLGHLGEFVAAAIFDIELEPSAANKGYDGRFRSGSLAGRTVDIKTYGKREGLIDLRVSDLPDFYLVLTGPSAPAESSRGASRPWVIEGIYLFDARSLVEALKRRGVKIGVASSVAQQYWQAAEIFPAGRNPSMSLSTEQRESLLLFSGRNQGV